MQLILSDNSKFDITIKENRVWDQLKRGYKHLQHVPIQFYPWDNGRSDMNKGEVIQSFIDYAKKLNISIDKSLCEQYDQQYLNFLHETYEKNYDGRPEWLQYHEHIHLLEKLKWDTHLNKKILHIRWRELAGMLEKPFEYDLINDSSTVIKKGDVFVKWQELGKIPYIYWDNGEPDNIDRINELCKPWIKLVYDFYIALEDIDFTENLNLTDFNPWWAKYHDSFCKHYNIPQWNIEQMCCGIVFGKIENLDDLMNNLSGSTIPYKIKL